MFLLFDVKLDAKWKFCYPHGIRLHDLVWILSPLLPMRVKTIRSLRVRGQKKDISNRKLHPWLFIDASQQNIC